MTITRYTDVDESFRGFLVAGLGVLVLELLLSATAIVRVP